MDTGARRRKGNYVAHFFLCVQKLGVCAETAPLEHDAPEFPLPGRASLSNSAPHAGCCRSDTRSETVECRDGIEVTRLVGEHADD
ncbi:hypothetical protein CapIbe_011082 [Capra ibex]